MRTTLDLNDAVLRQAKQRAAAAGRSLTSFIEDALRLALTRKPMASRKVRLRVYRNGPILKKGLSYDDTSALLDSMDELDASR